MRITYKVPRKEIRDDHFWRMQHKLNSVTKPLDTDHLKVKLETEDPQLLTYIKLRYQLVE